MHQPTNLFRLVIIGFLEAFNQIGHIVIVLLASASHLLALVVFRQPPQAGQRVRAQLVQNAWYKLR